MTGKFITIEGGEGAGKSTALETIVDTIQQRGYPVVTTREPGGTPLAERLREILLDKNNSEIHHNTELLLMFAARAQHLEELIKPALTKGQWVVCDRFTDATYAYQGGGRGIAQERIAQLEAWVQGELQPDLTLLLDLPVSQGLQRAGQRSEPDRFESQQQDFFDRVRACYRQRAQDNPQRFRLIDASQDIESVRMQIKDTLRDYLASL